MKRPQLIAIGLASALMLAVLVLMTPGDEPSETDLLLPALGSELASLQQLSLTGSEGQVTLKLQDGLWGIVERDGYPADLKQLTAVTTALSQAKRIEKKTAKAANHARLELVAPGAVASAANATGEASAEGTGLRIVGETSQGPLFDLVVGKAAADRDGQFVRFSDQDQTWLMSAEVNAPVSAEAWLAKDLVDISADDVLAALLTQRETGVTVQGVRDEDGVMHLTNPLPEGRELRYKKIGDELTEALKRVRLEDVRVRTLAANPAAVATFTLTNERQVKVTAFQEADEHWLQFDVTGDAPLADLGRWDYKVAMSVYERFDRGLEDFLAPLPEVDEPGTEPPAAP